MTTRKTTLFWSLLLLTGCDSESSGPRNLCETVPLPLNGAAAGPVVVDVGLEVQVGGIVPVATATDPQDTPNLLGALQSISVFPDARCEGSPILIQDDLAGSGVEETFGTVIDAAANPALYDAIADATTWPVEVDFQDIDGNHTTGRVLAVIR